MVDIDSTVRRFVTDVWHEAREDAARELVAEECPGLGGSGPEAVLAWHRERREAFPDLRYKIVDLIVSGERAALHWRAAGTQRGQFGAVPPTGQVVSYSGATFLRFDSAGKIIDVWSVNELFQLLQQLGVEMLPPLTGAGGPAD